MPFTVRSGVSVPGAEKAAVPFQLVHRATRHGPGIGLCGTPMSTLAMSAVDADRAGMASAVLNALRQVGQVFGVAVLGALVYAQLPTGGGGRQLDTAHAALFITGLHHALWVSGLALLAAAAITIALLIRPAHRRHHAERHPHEDTPG